MEPHDRRTIRSFRTYEDVQEHVFVNQDEEASAAALQELAMLQPRLIDLKNFSDFFAAELGPTLDTGTFWGLLGLLLTVRDTIMLQKLPCKVLSDRRTLVSLTTQSGNAASCPDA
jgi:hypothetical protein